MIPEAPVVDYPQRFCRAWPVSEARWVAGSSWRPKPWALTPGPSPRGRGVLIAGAGPAAGGTGYPYSQRFSRGWPVSEARWVAGSSWRPKPSALTPGPSPRGRGVLIASQGSERPVAQASPYSQHFSSAWLVSEARWWAGSSWGPKPAARALLVTLSASEGSGPCLEERDSSLRSE